MRKIKLVHPELSDEHKKLISEAEVRKLTSEEQDRLLHEVRSGNADAITPLVDSFKSIIAKLAIQLAVQNDSSSKVTAALIKEGRLSLEEMVKQELNSKSRERFFRFGAWVVKQRMIKVINGTHKS